jgi:predicted nucleotidyltransferase
MKNTIPTIPEREIILLDIAKALKEQLGENLISAIAYGSTLCEDFTSISDYDVLLIVSDASISTLYEVRKLKENFLKKNITIDFNTHSVKETPRHRKSAFWHNNRGHYMQIELSIFGKVLVGENPFQDTPTTSESLELECVRVINSLVYQARKLIVNRELTTEERVRMMKFCIYGTLYALAFQKKFPKTKTEAMKEFNVIYGEKMDPTPFLANKVYSTNTIPDTVVHEAYNFLEKLDHIIFESYKKRFL